MQYTDKYLLLNPKITSHLLVKLKHIPIPDQSSNSRSIKPLLKIIPTKNKAPYIANRSMENKLAKNM